ncbi:MAG: hypothetical protein GY755_23840 [Chloroflexi bacterium]|nr:hypothetical protein [Chloroflexota bacterium]
MHSLEKTLLLALLAAMALACRGTAATPHPEEKSATLLPATAIPDTVTTTIPESIPEPTEAGEVDSDSDTGVSIVGTWTSTCIDSGSGTYIIATIVFDETSQENDIVNFYSDPGCTSATGMVKTNQASYSLGTSTTASGKNAYEIDITINSWELKQDGALVTSGTNVPTQYDIIAVEGDTLYTGGSAATTSGDRPTVLDLSNFYTRQ